MKFLVILLIFITADHTVHAAGSDSSISIGHGLATQLSRRLTTVERRLSEIEGELRDLPVMPDVDAGGSHGFHSDFIPTSEENWFAVTWKKPRTIDGIGMIPTRIITQSGIRANYGLPVRMRIEATGPGRKGSFVLAEISDTRLDLRRGEPLFINLPPTPVTSLRFIPIDLPTLPGKTVRFFALAELMVYQGEENIADSGKFTASYSIDAEGGWNIRYLTDGQSPLGPPELPIKGKSLGWHADFGKTMDTPTWALIDLGAPHEFDAIRLIAASGDAPTKGPGIGFPVRFQMETADDAASGPWRSVWSTGDLDYINPGYNPALFRFPPTTARYVRLSVSKRQVIDHFSSLRVAISEMEILNHGKNLALGAPVMTPDENASITHDATRIWSRAGLTDGFSSSGTLIPERRWVSSLAWRFDLLCEEQKLRAERDQIISHWQQGFLALVFLSLSSAIAGLLVWQLRQRLVNRHAMRQLTLRISSDLHDEVGSNLATIALLSEDGSEPENLEDIHMLSLETSLSLREIVEITLAPKRAAKPLHGSLREIASLMLRKHQWSFEGSESPEIDLSQRRHLIFYFKECLHNIVRHANATQVRIILVKSISEFQLVVEDNGKGLQEISPDVMVALRTLRQRAASLKGRLDVISKPGEGTKLTLFFPLHTLSKK